MTLPPRQPRRIITRIDQAEINRAKELADLKAEQEKIYTQIHHLAPRDDEHKPHPMFPGRVERGKVRKHKPSKKRTTVTQHAKDSFVRTHRPWRSLEHYWPEHNRIVQIQVRGNTLDKTDRIPNAYHVDRKWFSADTNEPILAIVERWRMMPIDT